MYCDCEENRPRADEKFTGSEPLPQQEKWFLAYFPYFEWDGLRWHDIHTEFHKDSFSHLKLDREDTHTDSTEIA
jgi:hypothetical protein